MAKTTKKSSKQSKKTPDSVTVRYDLHDLPTAQHKAGLAGLLLQIESMKERVDHGALPEETPLVEIVEAGATHAVFSFTVTSTQALFDDLYAASVVELVVKKKWADTEKKPNPPKREIEVDVPDEKSRDGKVRVKKELRYVYDVDQPAGPFLARYTDDGKEIWHKLWRDMLWAIPRGKPTTRGPFKARAAGRPTKDGADAWKDLLAHHEAAGQGGLATTEVAGAILLGAQAISAEAVKFLDRADHALLLHFWQLTARVFVPEQVDADGKRDFVGYVLAVPEVANLPEFCRAYERGLAELKPESRGYRPAEAVVSLPAEGALEFMRQLAEIIELKSASLSPSRYLAGVEFFHMVKVGNNIKTAAHGSIAPRPRLLIAYDGLRKDVRNPLMLAGRVKALLDGRPWFETLTDELIEREWSWFVHSRQAGHETPWSMIGFAWEADKRFATMENNALTRKEENVNSPAQDSEAVDRVVYRLVGRYVREKAGTRLGVTPDDPEPKKKTHDPATHRERPDYQEARQRAASGLFLALRSRRGDDFVAHFTATLGSVAQYLPEEDYAVLAAALMRPFTQDVGEHRPRTVDDVKTLTLLALSANSRSLTTKAENVPTLTAGPAGEDDQ